MVYVLFIIILLLFILSFIINEKSIIAPAFVFSLGFIFQAIWVVCYARKWELGMHLNTFLVIALGIAEFIAVCYITHVLFNYINKKRNTSCEQEKNIECKEKIKFIKINNILEVLYLIFIVIVSICYLYFVVKSVNGSFTSISKIMEAISKHDNLSKFSEQSVNIPFIITNLEELVMASGYWFIYVAINNFLANKKINLVEILIVITTVISSMLNGSRTTAFMIMFSAIVIFIILLQKKKNNRNVISFHLLRNIAIIGCVFIVIFYTSAQIWGRADKNDKMYYFAIYCGAEVKNLDLFLQEKEYVKNSDIWGSQTFYSVIQTFGKKVAVNSFQDYKLDLPFRNVNGLNLGNVYTTFYPYIYDFGYFGEFVLVLLMAAISQFVYEMVCKNKLKNRPQILILIYSSIFNCLVLSFFSNKFYENIFSMKIGKHIIFWLVLNFIFCKLDYNKIMRRIKHEN